MFTNALRYKQRHRTYLLRHHFHLKYLQEPNIETLCSAVLETARSCASMAQPAQLVYERFKSALTLFSKCHHIYDSSQVSDEDIRNLSKCNKVTHAHYNTRFLLTEQHIPEFLAFYREAFPGATITPKLHMLEDHVVPWLEKWLVGFGLMGEQGAESVHASFNNMKLQQDTPITNSNS